MIPIQVTQVPFSQKKVKSFFQSQLPEVPLWEQTPRWQIRASSQLGLEGEDGN